MADYNNGYCCDSEQSTYKNLVCAGGPSLSHFWVSVGFQRVAVAGGTGIVGEALV
jgi:hypothetical protein